MALPINPSQDPQQFAKQLAKDAIKKAVMPYIIAALPWVALGGMILVIGITLYGFLSSGPAGVKALLLPDMNKPADRVAVLEVQANSGDKTAGAEIVTSAAAEILENEAKALTQEAAETQIQEKIEQAAAIVDSINTLGSGNISADLRNIKAIVEKVDEEDPLTKPGKLLELTAAPDNLAHIDEESVPKSGKIIAVAQAAEPTTYRNQAGLTQAANALDVRLTELVPTLETISQPRLIINQQDKHYIRNNQIDIRIINALNYLVRPQKYGGAGHQKIKVQRIKSDYDDEGDQYAYEWGSSPNLTSQTSPHYTGQAMDISVVDTVKRALFRKSIAKGKKRKIMADRDIVVAMQSPQGGKGRSRPGAETNGDSFMDMYQTAGLDTYLNEIEQNTGYDLSGAKGRSGNMGIVAQHIGIAVLAQEFGIPIDTTQDNSTLENLALNIGRNYAASCLALPADSVRGNNAFEIKQSIGQSMIESRLSLLPRSLTGNNYQEILTSVGKRKIESQLKIRPMSLQYLSSGQSFQNFIGQVVVEQTLGLSGGTFSPNSLEEAQQAVGEQKFEKIFGRAGSSLESGDKSDKIDQILGLDKKSRYTYRMKIGELSLNEYKNIVGGAYLVPYTKNFKDYPVLARAGVPSGETDNQVDESFDIPDGSMASILSGRYATFEAIGRDEVIKRLTQDDEERQVISAWMNNYAGQGLALGDIGFSSSYINNRELATVIRTRDFRIKTRSEIENNDGERAQQLRTQITEAKATLLQLERARTQSTTEKQLITKRIADLEEELLREEQELGNWIYLTTEELESTYGIPTGSINALFTNLGDSRPANMFGDIGRIRSEVKAGHIDVDEEAHDNTDELSEEYSTLIFEKEQLEEYISLLESSEGIDPADLSDAKVALANTNTAIAKIEKEHDEKVRMAAEDEAVGEQGVFHDSLGICNNETIRNILESNEQGSDLKNIFTQIGTRKVEQSLKLPKDALSLALRKIGVPQAATILMSDADRGRDYLESALDPNGQLTSGWLSSGTVEDVVARIQESVATNKPARSLYRYNEQGAAEAYLLSLFGYAKNTGLQNIRPALGSTNSTAYQTTLVTEKRLGDHLKNYVSDQRATLTIPTGSIARFLGGDIDARRLSEIIGKAYSSHPAVIAQSKTNIDDQAENNVKSLFSAEDIGQRTIEQLLDPRGAMGSNWFSGNTLGDVTLRVAQTIKKQPKNIFDVLPIRDAERFVLRGFGIGESNYISRLGNISDASIGEDKRTYAAIINFEKKLKSRLNILGQKSPIDGITLRLFGGSISPNEYSKQVGELYTKNKAARFINDSIKVSDGESVVTKNDILNFANGQYLDAAIAIGARSIDDGLSLPVGSIRALIDNPSLSCRVGIEGSNNIQETQSCVENILSENGKQKLASFVGILGNVNTPDNTKPQVGQASIEQTLYNPINGTQTPRQKEASDTIRAIMNADSLIQKNLPADWMRGQDLYEVRRNIAKSLYPTLAGVIDKQEEGSDKTLGRPVLKTAEEILLTLFGFSRDKSIAGLQNALWSESSNGLATTAEGTDKALGLPRGTTQRLFTNRITIEEYKRTAGDSHLENNTINGACSLLANGNEKKGTKAEKIFSILEKHNMDCADFVDGIRDPEAFGQDLLLNMLPARETGILLGLASYFDINVPIKGKFSENFANRQIEELLGLPDGSFGPDTSIQQIVAAAGAKQFAKAFRIRLPRQNMSNEEIATFLTSTVLLPKSAFRSSAEFKTYYWDDPIKRRSGNLVDSIFKITGSSELSNATESLLTGALSPQEYISLVRGSSLKDIDPTAVAEFILGGRNEGESFEKAKYLAGLIQGIVSPSEFAGATTGASKNYQAYVALRDFANLDLDEKLELVPGTTGNLLLHPDQAKSILMAQGIKELSEEILGSKFDLDDPDKVNLYNDLGFLIQYSIPGFNPGYAVSVLKQRPKDIPFEEDFNPKPSTSVACGAPSAPAVVAKPINVPDFTSAFGESGNPAAQKKYIEDAKKYSRDINAYNESIRIQKTYSDESYQKQKRSQCQDYVAKSFMSQTIKRLTSAKDKDGATKYEGITLQPHHIESLLSGDPNVFTAIAAAWSVSTLNAQRDNDGLVSRILPPQFQVNVEDVINSTLGNTAEKNKAAFLAGFEFEKERRKAPDARRDPEGYAKFQENLLAQETAFRERHPRVPNKEKDPSGYKAYFDKMERESLLKATSIPRPGTPEYTEYTKQRNIFIDKKVAKVKIEARENLMYSYLDAQAAVISENSGVPPLPPGFVKAMFKGSKDDKENALKQYGVSLILNSEEFKNSDLGKSRVFVTALMDMAENGSDPETALKNALEEKIDRSFEKLIGGSSFLDSDLGKTPGFTSELRAVIEDGKSPEDAIKDLMNKKLGERTGRMLEKSGISIPGISSGDLGNMVVSYVTTGEMPTDIGPEIGFSIADKKLGLPAGASKEYYQLADKAYDGDFGPGEYAQAIKIVFGKRLSTLDEKNNLPPGTMAAVVDVVFYCATGSPKCLQAVIKLVIIVVFGYSKIENQMICPPVGKYPTVGMTPEEIANIPYKGWHEHWCKETAENYRLWAQANTRQLIIDMLTIGEKTGDKELIPPLIGTFRVEDVDFANGRLEDINTKEKIDYVSRAHGSIPLLRGIKGVYQSDYMRGYVHVSF